MPYLDEIPITMTLTTPPPDCNEEHQSDDEPVVREVTQIDHLNRRLLKSFLERFNAGDLQEVARNESTNIDENHGDEFED